MNRIRRIAGAVFVLSAAACAQVEVPLQQSYEGPITSAPEAGAPVALVLDFRDRNGASFPADAVVVTQYRRLAGDALAQAGYALDPAAATRVTVTLRGRTDNGIVDNENNTARNMAVGVATLGIACREMNHRVDAEGVVAFDGPGGEARALDRPLRAASTSCHSTLNPSWLENHMKAAMETYEGAVSEHIAGWLPDLAVFVEG